MPITNAGGSAMIASVEREEKQEIQRQDLIQAWEDYQATGLHATAEEVEAWIAGWGTENELPVPECHV